MKGRVCIFDLDGTLLDTLDDLANSVNAALEAFHLPKRSREEIRAFVGNGVRRLVWRAVPEGTSETLYKAVFDKFSVVYAQEKDHYTKPYEGITALVAELAAQNVRCAVLSNKNDDAVKALCQKYFPNTFAYSQGLREGILPKPAPDALLSLCARMGISAGEALYIGDSEVDVQTAKAAQMPLVAVTWGFRERWQLEQAGAKVIIDSPEELLSVWTT